MEKETSEIAKLTERISKDPKSKLFVPLAEEHKKAGDIEMAIAVLSEGLKNNPGYVTAKSFLGRILLDKGDLPEAQKEFEEVIKAIPDNVLAQRKLGDIHVLQGRAQEALLYFNAVLAINPKDPELNMLVTDIKAGKDVRERIAGPKSKPVAGPMAAAVPPPGPLPSAAPPVKPSAAAVPPGAQAIPVSIPPPVEAEEPEEVLVFESLDEIVPVGALQQPEATHDMFADMAAETDHEDAARMDHGLTGGEDKLLFDSEPAPIDIPAADGSGLESVSQELSAPATGPESGSLDAGPGNRFFDSEPELIDIPAADSSGFDAAAAPELSLPVKEQESSPPDAGLSDSGFFDSEPIQAEPQQTADALDLAIEPAGNFPRGELEDMASSLDSSSEALIFDVEPVDEAQPSDRVSDSGPDVAADESAASFGETLPEADDFTTDTLAELYIAQGFYEKAIEIYERMLADRPNSKLLKDKLANVRAMGGASGVEEEQGTPVFFEARESPPVPSPRPVSEDGAMQWTAPGVEAREYTPPPADDIESMAFDSGFAPVAYVLPEAPVAVPLTPVEKEPSVREAKLLAVSLEAPASGKEQIIARLDNWLKNIIKEK